MTPPTAEELRVANENIVIDGQGVARATLEMLPLGDPTLKGWLNMMRLRIPASYVSDGMLQAALVYGLNLGLRIEEARGDVRVAKVLEAYSKSGTAAS